jgi:hypothetical protein
MTLVDELRQAIEAVRLAEEAGNERMRRLALDVLAAKLKTVLLYLQGRPDEPRLAELAGEAELLLDAERPGRRPKPAPPALAPEGTGAFPGPSSLLWKGFAADLVDGSLPGLTASDVRDAMGWLRGLADAIRAHAPDARIPELDAVPLWLDRLRHLHDRLDAEELAAAAIARLDRLARPRPGETVEVREALGELATARDAANDAVVAVRAAGGPATRRAARDALDELGRAIDQLDRRASELREIEEQLVAQGVRVERLPVRDRPPERWREEAAIADTLRRPLERAARQARQDASWMADLAGPLPPPAEEGADAEPEPSGVERLERESARVDAARERALSRLRELRAALDGLPRDAGRSEPGEAPARSRHRAVGGRGRDRDGPRGAGRPASGSERRARGPRAAARERARRGRRPRVERGGGAAGPGR